MKYLTYDETMEIVEDFNQKSGIAKFCRETCLGRCCGSCWTSKNACHKHEGRRLACTAFICGSLFDDLGFHYDTDLRDKWLTSKGKINATTEPFLTKKRWDANPPNPYFMPPKLAEMKANFRIPKEDVCLFFNAEYAAMIYEKIQNFIITRKKLIDTHA